MTNNRIYDILADRLLHYASRGLHLMQVEKVRLLRRTTLPYKRDVYQHELELMYQDEKALAIARRRIRDGEEIETDN